MIIIDTNWNNIWDARMVKEPTDITIEVCVNTMLKVEKDFNKTQKSLKRISKLTSEAPKSKK